MNNIIICSFYTDDDYYKSKKVELTNSLDRLGLNHDIQLLSIPEGMKWSDICRQKISFLANMCNKHSDKKVFWIDVDCSIDHLPSFIAESSADIIGFARGFSSPMKVGYHLRSRFWEPCFLGINNTHMGKKFIADANKLEKAFKESATDDYFFEEAWRKNCEQMSYQIIPSTLNVKHSGDNENDETGFFHFGASGNVAQFKGNVAQHSKNNHQNQIAYDTLIAMLEKSGLHSPAKRIYLGLLRRYHELSKKDESTNPEIFKSAIFQAARKNDHKNLKKLENLKVKFSSQSKNNSIKQAMAILEYGSYSKNDSLLPLCWWFNPAPGNMGDWLSPYIFSRVAQRNVKLITPSEMKKHDSMNFVGIGSIGKFINDHSICIGAGISRNNTKLNPNATYLSVRGPKTGSILELCGGKDPGFYGDPAIVMPRLYPKSKIKGERCLLVRHLSHLNFEVTLPENIDELSIFAASAKEIESFIDKLHNYEYVITSAMHCYILCHAYGIPSALVTFEGAESAVAGDGIKYIDYAEGVNVEAISPTIIPTNLKNQDFSKIVKNIKISDEKIDNVFNFLKQSLNQQD